MYVLYIVYFYLIFFFEKRPNVKILKNESTGITLVYYPVKKGTQRDLRLSQNT